MIDAHLLASAKNGTRRAGQAQLVKYLSGGRITRNEAIKAKCYDCDGMGESGACGIAACPLYPWSPYFEEPQPKKGLLPGGVK